MQGTEHEHGGRRPRGARWLATHALLFVVASAGVAAPLLWMASLASILYNDKPVGPTLEEAERKSSEVLSGS